MALEFQNLSSMALQARSWPFEQAKNLLARITVHRLSDPRDQKHVAELFAKGKFEAAILQYPSLGTRPVVFETGYGPSGLPHIGTFGEVARTTMVRNAFRALTEDVFLTRLICFSDDMDGLRKVPPNLPNQERLAEDIGKPLTKVRDPFDLASSFAAHNNAKLCSFLDSFGFSYDFFSSTQCYQSGLFDEALLLVLERFDAIQAIMLPTLGEERRASYSPFLPISPKTGRVLAVPTLERNLAKGTIVFMDEDGQKAEVPVTQGHVKLQWKPDWGMRWTALGIDYEMAGKDLIDSVKVSSKICRILGGVPPEGFNYELFLDQNNQKISKTKGNGLSIEDWLRYSIPESLSYYMFQSPRSAKRLFFDIIPKATDEYLQQRNQFVVSHKANASNIETTTNPLDHPIWHIHSPNFPDQGVEISFSMLLNLVSAANSMDKEILWGFLSRYLPDLSPETAPLLDRLTDYAITYYHDFVKPDKSFRLPDNQERQALLGLLARLKSLPPDTRDAELIQTEVYAAGKEAGFEPLRLWFQSLYQTLLGQDQGPRFGSFIALYGLDRSLAMIEDVLSKP